MLFGLNVPKMVRKSRPIPVTASRSQVLRGENRIAWFFEKKRPLKRNFASSGSAVIQAAWASESEDKKPGLTLFFVASKRDVREAHDRKKLKRWMREAVRRSEGLAIASSVARSGRNHVYLMLRVRQAPGIGVNWKTVLSNVLEIGEAMSLAGSPKKATLPELRKKGISK